MFHLQLHQWLMLYFGGMFVTALSTSFELVAYGKNLRWLMTLLCVVLWPLLLPLSFLCLWISACYWGLALGLFVSSKVKADFRIKGRRIALSLEPS